MKKIFLLLTALAFFSCDDYLDVNQNTQTADFSQISPKLILPGAQLNAFRVQQGSLNSFGNIMMNSWAGNVNAFAGLYVREFNLLVTPSFYAGIWNGIYVQVANFQHIIEYDNKDNAQDNYIAISKILKAHYLQYVVDLYGDAPYTEAFKGFENTTPKYDDDVTIYKALITELEEARAIIAAANPSAIAPGNTDIMFGGDMAKWTKFANLVQLRMLTRMSKITDTDLITYRDSKLDDLTGKQFLEEATLNPGYSKATNSNMNPFLLNLINSAGNRTSANQQIVASGHMAKFLNGKSSSVEIIAGSGRNYPDREDFRGRVMWRRKKVGFITEVKGVDQGLNSGDAGVPASLSDIGFATFDPYNKAPLAGALTAYKDFLAHAVADSYVFTASQTAFLLAEAALEFPTKFPGINANAQFDLGIKKSYDFYNFPQALNAYMGNINNKVGLDFTGTKEQKLEAIMTQKWVASTHINAGESYIDFVKTGYPLTPLATTALQPNKPYRLDYPNSEYNSNTENTPVITKADLFTVTDKTPFWKK